MNEVVEKSKLEFSQRSLKNLQQVLEDGVCRKEIRAQISVKAKQRMISPPAGMKWKRGAYDTLSEAGKLSVDYFVQEYPLIEKKKINSIISY